jgi:hypothetical protein
MVILPTLTALGDARRGPFFNEPFCNERKALSGPQEKRAGNKKTACL